MILTLIFFKGIGSRITSLIGTKPLDTTEMCWVRAYITCLMNNHFHSIMNTPTNNVDLGDSNDDC